VKFQRPAIISAICAVAISFILIFSRAYSPTWESQNKKRVLQSIDQVLDDQSDGKIRRLIKARKILDEVGENEISDYKFRSKIDILKDFIDRNSSDFLIYENGLDSLSNARADLEKISKAIDICIIKLEEMKVYIAGIEKEIAHVDQNSLLLICESERVSNEGVYVYGQAVGNDDKMKVPGFRLSPSPMLILGVDKSQSAPIATIRNPGSDPVVIGPFLSGTMVIFNEKSNAVNLLGETVDLYVYTVVDKHKMNALRSGALEKISELSNRKHDYMDDLARLKIKIATEESLMKINLDRK